MRSQNEDSWKHTSTIITGLTDTEYTFSQAEDGCRIIEVSALTEGAALIAAGRYLELQAVSGAPSTIEEIDWLVPGTHSPKHTLIITASALEWEEAC